MNDQNQQPHPKDTKFTQKTKAKQSPTVFLYVFAVFGVLFFLAVLIFFLPPVHDRLAWRLETLITRALYLIDPPDQAVFIPQPTVKGVSILRPSPTPRITATPTAADFTTTPAAPDSLSTPTRTPTVTLTPTPLPSSAALKGIRFQYQSFNNCGPANLAMALSFWGWHGDQRDTKAVLRPSEDDSNVMPAEMVAFVESAAHLKAALRFGGSVDTLRAFVSAGYPVIIEVGEQPKGDWWLGHYLVISGYDDARAQFITQDSLVMEDLPMPYKQLDEHGWRDFNYTYIVIYPPERESQVLAMLGPDADPVENYLRALARARVESEGLEGRERFFALYSIGTNLLALDEIEQAAAVYDEAFGIYASLDDEKKLRPWRVLWYQTGPYEVYYRAGRYQDVINLANSTLGWLSKRGLEESHYWRGLAYEALGQPEKAVADYEIALKLRPTYTLAQEALARAKEVSK